MAKESDGGPSGSSEARHSPAIANGWPERHTDAPADRLA